MSYKYVLELAKSYYWLYDRISSYKIILHHLHYIGVLELDKSYYWLYDRIASYKIILLTSCTTGMCGDSPVTHRGTSNTWVPMSDWITKVVDVPPHRSHVS